MSWPPCACLKSRIMSKSRSPVVALADQVYLRGAAPRSAVAGLGGGFQPDIPSRYWREGHALLGSAIRPGAVGHRSTPGGAVRAHRDLEAANPPVLDVRTREIAQPRDVLRHLGVDGEGMRHRGSRHRALALPKRGGIPVKDVDGPAVLARNLLVAGPNSPPVPWQRRRGRLHRGGR